MPLTEPKDLFVGCRAEFGLLRAALDEVRAGRPRMGRELPVELTGGWLDGCGPATRRLVEAASVPGVRVRPAIAAVYEQPGPAATSAGPVLS